MNSNSFAPRSVTPPPVYSSPSMSSRSGLKPYLELSHLISLSWLAYPILSLLFIAFRMWLSSSAATDAVASTKANLIASCAAAEKAASGAASMPRFMAIAANQRMVSAVNDTLNGARAALVLSLTVMEAIINFIVDIYRSTFLCFVELVIRGGLALILAAIQGINEVLGAAANDVRTGFQSAISGVDKAIQAIVDTANKVPFVNVQAPQIPIPDLTSLQNVQIPASVSDSIQKLNSTLPTFKEIKDKVNQLLDTPFELVKKDINDTFSQLSFNSSTLPVPEQNNVVFCDKLDTDIVDEVGREIIKAFKIGIAVLFGLALLLFLCYAAVEWYKWRRLQAHLIRIRNDWATDPSLQHTTSATGHPTMEMNDYNLMILGNTFQHPMLIFLANKLSALFRLKSQTYIHVRWFLSYVFHPYPFTCLAIGVLGILTVQIQLAIIHGVTGPVNQRAQASAVDFQNTITTQINASMYNQSSAYASSVNAQVLGIQNSIDQGVFGWVNGTTSTLNDTLNAFYDEVQSIVELAFGGTILDQPVQEFVRCFIGSKVDALESAITFLHDNLNVQLPTVNDDVLVLSPEDVNSATKPIALAAVGDGSDSDSGGAVGKLLANYEKSLRRELIMFYIFVAIWLFVVLVALGVIVYHTYFRGRAQERKMLKHQMERAGSVEAFEKDRGLSPSVTKAPMTMPIPAPAVQEKPASTFEEEEKESMSKRLTRLVTSARRSVAPSKTRSPTATDNESLTPTSNEDAGIGASMYRRMTTLLGKRPALRVDTDAVAPQPTPSPASFSAGEAPVLTPASRFVAPMFQAPPPPPSSPPKLPLARDSALPRGPLGLRPSPQATHAPVPLHSAFASPVTPPAFASPVVKGEVRSPIYGLQSTPSTRGPYPAMAMPGAGRHRAKQSSGNVLPSGGDPFVDQDPFGNPFGVQGRY